MLTLATLPTEILTNITSLITRWNEIEPLCFTGNSLLTTKLQLGGLKSFEFDTSLVTRGHLKFLSTIRLESAHVIASLHSPAPHRVLIHHTIPFLRHLSIDWPSVPSTDLFATSTLNLASSSKEPLYNPFEPWIVSKSFPLLESLHISRLTWRFKSDMENCFNDSFCTAFLRGLPRSLTSLHVPSLIVPDWNLLPPGITSLEDVHGTFPLSAALRASLQNLSLLSIAPTQTAVALIAEASDDQSLLIEHEKSIVKNNFVCPPNLTRLSLDCGSSALLLMLSMLSPNLTTLELQREQVPDHDADSLNFDSFLAAIPASITSLSVNKFLICSTSLRAIEVTPKCPNVRKLKFFCKLAAESDHLYLLLYQKIISSMSGVEHLELASNRFHVYGFAPEDLVLFSPRLRRLKAKLSPDCFTFSSNGSYHTLQCFPNLTHLELLSVNPTPNFKFTFASIPPSVTHLGLGSLLISPQEMQNLPTTITRLRSCGIVAEDFDYTIGPFLTSPPTREVVTLPTISMDHDEQYDTTAGSSIALGFDTYTFVPIPAFNDQLSRINPHKTNINTDTSNIVSGTDIILGDGTPRDAPHFWLSPCDYSASDIINVSWNFANLPQIPSFVVHLMLARFSPETMVASITPSSLPLLESLSLKGNLPADLKLTDFTRLSFLRIGSITEEYNFELPPSLTSLNCYSYESHIPLPPSITRFVYDSPRSLAFQDLQALPNLVQFGSTSEDLNLENHLKLAEQLFYSTTAHPLITQLWISGSFKVKKRGGSLRDLSNFSKRFPSLENLHIQEEIDYPTFIALYSIIPPRTILHGGAIFEISGDDSKDLCKRCTAKQLDPKCYTLEECIDQVFEVAFPRWNRHKRGFVVFIFDDSSWKAFTSLLSPRTHTLKISTHFMLGNGFGRHLPSFITKLEIVSDSSSLTSYNLPTSLSHLTIKLENKKCLIPQFPQSLSSLTIDADLTTFTEQHALRLPPMLTFLSLRVFKVEDKVFTALPPSISRLTIEGKFELKLPQLSSIASHVLLYQGNLDKECARMILDPTYTGTLAWVAPRSSVLKARKLIGEYTVEIRV